MRKCLFTVVVTLIVRNLRLYDFTMTVIMNTAWCLNFTATKLSYTEVKFTNGFSSVEPLRMKHCSMSVNKIRILFSEHRSEFIISDNNKSSYDNLLHIQRSNCCWFISVRKTKKEKQKCKPPMSIHITRKTETNSPA